VQATAEQTGRLSLRSEVDRLQGKELFREIGVQGHLDLASDTPTLANLADGHETIGDLW
jgi:hypothetical protein